MAWLRKFRCFRFTLFPDVAQYVWGSSNILSELYIISIQLFVTFFRSLPCTSVVLKKKKQRRQFYVEVNFSCYLWNVKAWLRKFHCFRFTLFRDFAQYLWGSRNILSELIVFIPSLFSFMSLFLRSLPCALVIVVYEGFSVIFQHGRDQ